MLCSILLLGSYYINNFLHRHSEQLAQCQECVTQSYIPFSDYSDDRKDVRLEIIVNEIVFFYCINYLLKL